MKIAIITPYRNYYGGVENFNRNLTDILKENNEITYITCDGLENKYSKLLQKLFGQSYITYREYKKDKNSYDIVICNGEFGFGIHHKRCINVFHGSYYGILKNSSKKIGIRERLHLKRLALFQKISAKDKYVVAVSEYLKDILEDSGIRVDKIINNSVDLIKFKPEKTAKKKGDYIFVGSYNYYSKGFDVLEKLSNSGFDITCVTNKKLSRPLKYIENIDNSKMKDIYNSYKVLLFPSTFESFGYVPLEALACGIPILMHDVGIGKELLKIEKDFVISLKSKDRVQEYMDSIEKINNNYELYSKKARKIAEEMFGFDTFENNWCKLLEEFYEHKL